MAKETIAPASKPVPSSGGVKDGGSKTLTTPRKDNDGTYWTTAKAQSTASIK